MLNRVNLCIYIIAWKSSEWASELRRDLSSVYIYMSVYTCYNKNIIIMYLLCDDQYKEKSDNALYRGITI